MDRKTIPKKSKVKRPKSFSSEVDVSAMVEATTAVFHIPQADDLPPPEKDILVVAVHKPLHHLPGEDTTEEEGDVRRASPKDSSLQELEASPSKEQTTVPGLRSTDPKRRKKRRRHQRTTSSKVPPLKAISGSSTDKPSERKPLEEADLPLSSSLESIPPTGLPAPQLRSHLGIQGTTEDQTSGALSRQPGVEYLQKTVAPRHRRRRIREPQSPEPKESTTTLSPERRRTLPGFLRLRSAPTSYRTSPSRQADLRRLLGSLDLTTADRRDRKIDAQQDASEDEPALCPFALPPDVGTGFVLEPPVKATGSVVLSEPRRFRLTRTRSLPDLETQNAAPEFLRNRLVLQTDDSVYLPFILRKEYVIRTKLRVQFRLLKRSGRARSKSVGDSATVTFLDDLLCRASQDSGSDQDEGEWRVDEGCDFFGFCYFRCKCCKKRQAERARDAR
ncbi:hypothetical protein HPB47_012036 [Ixodes persulcatus]|uniref:Uncharacterized protein n=1 Tax=Ixodes persulcatus TaxID=34615 RepID=A0AC60NUQ2_IXOPE|nr:hypothetical protein HPB47_012036 [Ixodes persulcatus]